MNRSYTIQLRCISILSTWLGWLCCIRATTLFFIVIMFIICYVSFLQLLFLLMLFFPTGGYITRTSCAKTLTAVDQWLRKTLGKNRPKKITIYASSYTCNLIKNIKIPHFDRRTNRPINWKLIPIHINNSRINCSAGLDFGVFTSEFYYAFFLDFTWLYQITDSLQFTNYWNFHWIHSHK